MQTSVTAGAAIPPEDTEIVKAIIGAVATSGTLNRDSSLRWQVGVRNAEGVIYRRTTFRTRNQLSRLALRLRRLGYLDEADSDAAAQAVHTGYDAVFSRRGGPHPASSRSGA